MIYPIHTHKMGYYSALKKQQWNPSIRNNVNRPWGHLLTEKGQTRKINTVWSHLQVKLKTKTETKAKRPPKLNHR